MAAENYSSFMLMVSGQVSTAEVRLVGVRCGSSSSPPLFVCLFVCSLQFPEFDTLYCKVGFVYGADWTVLAGIEEGVSQVASRSHDGAGRFVWNFPIELTLRSTNPFGCTGKKRKN
jgi:hypothetical protein